MDMSEAEMKEIFENRMIAIQNWISQLMLDMDGIDCHFIDMFDGSVKEVESAYDFLHELKAEVVQGLNASRSGLKPWQ